MKTKLYQYLIISVIASFSFSCQDFEEINTDPNNPAETPSNMLFSGTQKKIMDYVYDVWFSGRQSLLYAQYWGQRNYTEEDRYQIRESVNNNYFNVFYTLIANLDKVIELNTNPETAAVSSAYGNNSNQIAAAKILKAWLFSIMTDTWGNIPYSEAGKLEEGIYYPKYDSQELIYEELIKELTEAAGLIDESDVAFVGGDRIYFGDASKWKKFANSLKLRLAVHTSKVSGSKWKEQIAEALAGGVFENNGDVAAYHYGSAPEYSYFYEGFFISARNDFSVTRPFVDILKGQRDTLNDKTHPWENVVDPRLPIYTTPHNNGEYTGIPYGISSGNMTAALRNMAPNLYAAPPVVLNPDFPVPLMTYAEVQFIISEYRDFSEDEYRKGVNASIEYWAGLDGTAPDKTVTDGYIEAVSQNVNAETVALQKYIDLYMNGMEAWTEIRRTGYPTQLLRPGEISVVNVTTENETEELRFEPLSDTKGQIIARVKYPTNESTLNKPGFEEAISKLEDRTNNYYTPMFWDKRRTEGAHPANK